MQISATSGFATQTRRWYTEAELKAMCAKSGVTPTFLLARGSLLTPARRRRFVDGHWRDDIIYRRLRLRRGASSRLHCIHQEFYKACPGLGLSV